MDLRSYLSERNISVPAFASDIRVSVAAVHRYLNKERRPRDDVMARIVQATKGEVRPDDFFSFTVHLQPAQGDTV